MAIGYIRASTDTFGVRSQMPLPVIPIGRRIATASGDGCRHTDGRGSMTSHGVGRPIITDAGSGITTPGTGPHTDITAIDEAGGNRHWSLSASSTTMCVGIRWLIISTITTTTGIGSGTGATAVIAVVEITPARHQHRLQRSIRRLPRS